MGRESQAQNSRDQGPKTTEKQGAQPEVKMASEGRTKGAAGGAQGGGGLQAHRQIRSHSPRSPGTAPPQETSWPPRAPAGPPGPCCHTAKQTGSTGSCAEGTALSPRLLYRTGHRGAQHVYSSQGRREESRPGSFPGSYSSPSQGPQGAADTSFLTPAWVRHH